MKRTALRSKVPLRRRRSVRKRNAKRAKAKFERNYGAYSDVIRAFPCIGCGVRAPSDAAHAIPRGMGGCGGDKTTLVPLCGWERPFPRPPMTPCHWLYDNEMDRFTERTGLTKEDVIAHAAELWAAHQKEDRAE